MKELVVLFLNLLIAGSLQAQHHNRTGFGSWGKPVKILNASYGANCNVGLVGNKTDMFRFICSQQGSVCQYIVNPYELGDPYPGCGKDLEVTYQCSDRFPKTEVIRHDVGGKLLQLFCY